MKMKIKRTTTGGEDQKRFMEPIVCQKLENEGEAEMNGGR